MKRRFFGWMWVVGWVLVSGGVVAQEEYTLEEKIGQLLLLGFRGLELSADSEVLEHIRLGKVGGIILFDYDVINKEFVRNISSAEQVRSLNGVLQDAARIPLFVSVDQEGGRVLRLKPRYGFPAIPSQRYLGELDNVDSTRYYAALNAKNMRDLGFNLNFAPVVDLNLVTESGVIGYLERSFSADPEVVARHAGIVAEESYRQGVIPVLKHFPGHGSARDDSHYGITDVTETWTEEELKPYRLLFDAGYKGGVMTAHVFNKNIDPVYPATLSAAAMRLLREDLGYSGVVFSDDMHMKAVSEQYGLEEAILLSLAAGVDVFCFGNNLLYDAAIPDKFRQIVLDGIAAGRISVDQIETAFARIMALKKAYGIIK
jgi:beta-N-acetylhexosaminidase